MEMILKTKKEFCCHDPKTVCTQLQMSGKQGESNGETLEPERDGLSFGKWFSGLLSRYPSAYTQVDKYLREVMPDIQDFMNELIGKDSKNMIVRFEANNANMNIDFTDLSDGEIKLNWIE
jgi:hypothetical protein